MKTGRKRGECHIGGEFMFKFESRRKKLPRIGGMCAVGDIQSVGIRRGRPGVKIGAGTRSIPVRIQIEGRHGRVTSIEKGDSAASLLAFVCVFIQYRIVNVAIASRVKNTDTSIEHARNERPG